jgi:hypothetical protein
VINGKGCAMFLNRKSNNSFSIWETPGSCYRFYLDCLWEAHELKAWPVACGTQVRWWNLEERPSGRKLGQWGVSVKGILEHGLSSPSLCFMATTSSFLCHVFLL